SASKTLAPGVRLGWLVPPAHLLDDVVAAKAAADRQSGALDQLTLAELITSGGYDRHVRHCRLAYRRRRDRLVALLHARVPPVRVTGIAAGLHAVVELPSTVDEREVVAMAAERGLALHGLSAFGGRPGPALVVAAGYDVVLSNSRGPQTLTDLVAELGPHARAATPAEAAAAGDLVVVSIPLRAYREVPAEPLAGKVVIDTDNYYPQRDGHIG